MMSVLVAYATRGGSTAEIAEWIAEELRAAGLSTEVRAAAEVQSLTAYEAVVLGAAVYVAGWHNDARRFAHRFAEAMPPRPVWLFSSGPLDTSAEATDLAPLPQAEIAVRALRARGHITFGGKLSQEAHGWLGFIAKRMTQEGRGGDFRNPQRVRGWARGIAAEIISGARGSD
jgi:menaquinone-dependent protoporphyrinogen oxidase